MTQEKFALSKAQSDFLVDKNPKWVYTIKSYIKKLPSRLTAIFWPALRCVEAAGNVLLIKNEGEMNHGKCN